jgi:hypothetical protein
MTRHDRRSNRAIFLAMLLVPLLNSCGGSKTETLAGWSRCAEFNKAPHGKKEAVVQKLYASSHPTIEAGDPDAAHVLEDVKFECEHSPDVTLDSLIDFDTQSPSDAPTISDPAPSGAVGISANGVPAGSYLLTCTPTMLQYFDPTNGKLISSQSITPIKIVPTRNPLVEGQDCDSWQLSADGTHIAGIDHVGQSSVPAIQDLFTGLVTDLVSPPDTQRFDKTAPLAYMGTYFDRAGADVWTMECVQLNATDTQVVVHRPKGGIAYRIPPSLSYGLTGNDCDHGSPDDPGLLFLHDSALPVPVFKSPGDGIYGNLSILPRTENESARSILAEERYLPIVDQSKLPDSNYSVSTIVHSLGTRAMFIGFQRAEVGAPLICALFEVASTGGEPIKVAGIQNCAPGADGKPLATLRLHE